MDPQRRHSPASRSSALRLSRYGAAGASPKPSQRSVGGLASRAVSVTVQRFLDIWSIHHLLTDRDAPDRCAVYLLLAMLVLTTGVMAATMQRHWSAKNNRAPHGTYVAWVVSVLQVAPLYEMYDKAFVGKPSLRTSASTQPLLQHESRQTWSPAQASRSHVPKGSPGENVMRGVRKLSIINVLQASLSLWFHARQLVPGSDQDTRTAVLLLVAFAAALICVVIGIADFVVYIWIHDAFVRENKKLVTIHFLVEIMCRVPTVVLFHVSYSRVHDYWPTIVLVAFDMIATSALLTLPRVTWPDSWADVPDMLCSGARRAICWRCCSLRHCLEFVYSLVISFALFTVNIVFFDPGMTFFNVNIAFFWIKYVELFVMLSLIRRSSTSKLVFFHPHYSLYVFCCFTFAIALLNIFVAYWRVPAEREKKNARMTNMTPVPSVSDEGFEPTHQSSPRTESLDGSGRMLESLEETFEMMRLLGACSCQQNRQRILNSVVSQLWLHALRWDGDWITHEGQVVHLRLIGPMPTVSLSYPQGESDVAEQRARDFARGVLDGPKISLHVVDGAPLSAPSREGCSDGELIRWEDGTTWARTEDHRKSASQARSVMRLVLPQLALALRWDITNTSGQWPIDAQHSLLAYQNIEEGRAVRNESSECSGLESSTSRPLLKFLFNYAVMTRQADFISDLYWALHCLSHEEGESAMVARAYRSSRLVLLRWLREERGPTAVAPHDDGVVVAAFLRRGRHILLCQKELWQQKMDLLASLGHHGGASRGGFPGRRINGSGAWVHRTNELRDRLRNWCEYRQSYRTSFRPDEDSELLHDRNSPNASSSCVADAAGGMLDLVDPEASELVTLSIDPTVPFGGIDVEECEVVPSKHAPVLFACKMFAHDAPAENNWTREKYLLKTGDDLRQDQLMLQMMALMECVWQERLNADDAKMLQLAKFRVLAVTPQSGYVKFVPDAVPLTDALHESHGDLVAWLDQKRPRGLPLSKVIDTLCGSVAASSVVTYILGIGDRHLENLCITNKGQFFHIDFSFVLGDDPKPIAPQVRLPPQVAQALGDRLPMCFELAGRAYLALRPFAGLWGSILQLTAAAGGAGCRKLEDKAIAAVAGVRERLRVDQPDDDLAASEFITLVRESTEGLGSIVMDKVHAMGLFWR